MALLLLYFNLSILTNIKRKVRVQEAVSFIILGQLIVHKYGMLLRHQWFHY